MLPALLKPAHWCADPVPSLPASGPGQPHTVGWLRLDNRSRALPVLILVCSARLGEWDSGVGSRVQCGRLPDGSGDSAASSLHGAGQEWCAGRHGSTSVVSRRATGCILGPPMQPLVSGPASSDPAACDAPSRCDLPAPGGARREQRRPSRLCKPPLLHSVTAAR